MSIQSPSQYDCDVADYVKVSVTMDAEVLARAREIAGPRGLSAYVTEAVRRENSGRGLDELLEESVALNGPSDPAEVERIRKILRS